VVRPLGADSVRVGIGMSAWGYVGREDVLSSDVGSTLTPTSPPSSNRKNVRARSRDALLVRSGTRAETRNPSVGPARSVGDGSPALTPHLGLIACTRLIAGERAGIVIGRVWRLRRSDLVGQRAFHQLGRRGAFSSRGKHGEWPLRVGQEAIGALPFRRSRHCGAAWPPSPPWDAPSIERPRISRTAERRWYWFAASSP